MGGGQKVAHGNNTTKWRALARTGVRGPVDEGPRDGDARLACGGQPARTSHSLLTQPCSGAGRALPHLLEAAPRQQCVHLQTGKDDPQLDSPLAQPGPPWALTRVPALGGDALSDGV